MNLLVLTWNSVPPWKKQSRNQRSRVWLNTLSCMYQVMFCLQSLHNHQWCPITNQFSEHVVVHVNIQTSGPPSQTLKKFSVFEELHPDISNTDQFSWFKIWKEFGCIRPAFIDGLWHIPFIAKHETQKLDQIPRNLLQERCQLYKSPFQHALCSYKTLRNFICSTVVALLPQHV